METRYCKRDSCPYTIDKEKRSDAVYCSPKCGWRDRNRKKAKERKEEIKDDPGLERNRKIIKDLHDRGIYDISVEALKEIGFDFNSYSRIGKVDHENGATEIKIYEFVIFVYDKRFKLKKIGNGYTRAS